MTPRNEYDHRSHPIAQYLAAAAFGAPDTVDSVDLGALNVPEHRQSAVRTALEDAAARVVAARADGDRIAARELARGETVRLVNDLVGGWDRPTPPAPPADPTALADLIDRRF